MKKSFYLLILIIFSGFLSCQSDEKMTDVEKGQNELLGLIESEIGKVEGAVYLIPSSLGTDQLMLHLASIVDRDSERTILLLGEIEDKNTQAFVKAVKEKFEGIYETKKSFNSVKSEEKIEMIDGLIRSRITLEDFELDA